MTDQVLGDTAKRPRADQLDRFFFEIGSDRRFACRSIGALQRRQQRVRNGERRGTGAGGESLERVAERERFQKRVVEPLLPTRRQAGSVENAREKAEVAKPQRPILEPGLLDGLDDDRDGLGLGRLAFQVAEAFDAGLAELARMRWRRRPAAGSGKRRRCSNSARASRDRRGAPGAAGMSAR